MFSTFKLIKRSFYFCFTFFLLFAAPSFAMQQFDSSSPNSQLPNSFSIPITDFFKRIKLSDFTVPEQTHQVKLPSPLDAGCSKFCKALKVLGYTTKTSSSVSNVKVDANRISFEVKFKNAMLFDRMTVTSQHDNQQQQEQVNNSNLSLSSLFSLLSQNEFYKPGKLNDGQPRIQISSLNNLDGRYTIAEFDSEVLKSEQITGTMNVAFPLDGHSFLSQLEMKKSQLGVMVLFRLNEDSIAQLERLVGDAIMDSVRLRSSDFVVENEPRICGLLNSQNKEVLCNSFKGDLIRLSFGNSIASIAEALIKQVFKQQSLEAEIDSNSEFVPVLLGNGLVTSFVRFSDVNDRDCVSFYPNMVDLQIKKLQSSLDSKHRFELGNVIQSHQSTLKSALQQYEEKLNQVSVSYEKTIEALQEEIQVNSLQNDKKMKDFANERSQLLSQIDQLRGELDHARGKKDSEK